jgi:hypothetical protein
LSDFNPDNSVKWERRVYARRPFMKATECHVATIERLRKQGYGFEDIAMQLRLDFDSVKQICGVKD